MSVSVCGIGCSLVDYLFTNVSFSTAPFTKYRSKVDGDGGLTPGKLVFTDDFSTFTGRDFLQALDEITGGRKPNAINLGGPAIIAMANAAQLCPGDDTSFSFFGAMGDDEKSHALLGFLENVDINLSHYERIPGTTPFTYVFSDPTYHQGKGERAFINNIGVGWDYLPTSPPKDYFDGDILLFGATAIVPGVNRHLSDMLKTGHTKGKLTIVTTVYDFLSEQSDPNKPWPLGTSDEAYRYIDLLITDLEEAVRLSGESDQHGAASVFAELGVGTTIITNGANDVHVQVNGGRFAPTTHTFMPVCAAVDEEIAHHPDRAGDTTGCGDNFAGGILASVAQQISGGSGTLDIVDAVAWGAASGGFARFTVGGLYTEKAPWEKHHRVGHYRAQYNKQIGG